MRLSNWWIGSFILAGATCLPPATAATTQRASTRPAEPTPARPAEPVPSARAAAARARTENSIINEILDQLASADPAQHKAAIAAIRSRLTSRGLGDTMRTFARPLANAREHAAIADLTREGILLSPSDTRGVEAALQARIRALMALGRTQEALADARSLFNVSTMAGTSDAILAVAEAINAAYPKDVEMFNRFREEQIAGAAPPPASQPATQPTNPPATRTSAVLASIRVDTKPYDEALAKMPGEDAASLMGRGNLLLMAARPAEARPIFERLYTLGTADLTESSEALARCIKAEDGTIARANAWVLSIRPKK